MDAAVLRVLVQAQGIAATTRDLRKVDASARTAASGVDDLGERGSRSMGLLKKAAGLLAGVAVFDMLRRGVGAAVGEFQEARKVGALTEQAIRSTGGAANVTAKQVATLTAAISRKVGIDNEAIQKGANLLLTFKNIRNEAGAGRDIFNQATAAAVDLSAAGFGSLESASKQLGKALNDPVKGITALGRAGVTFSDGQKKAIDALMATGKAADRVRAQQIILKEVQSQVGGAAAAQATPMDKLRVTLGNLAEMAGGVLVPAFDKGARFVTTMLNQMMESRGAGGAIVDVFKAVGDVIGWLVDTVRGVVGWFRQHETVTLALAAAIGVVLAAFLGFKILAAVQAAIVAVRGAMLALNLAFLANPVVLVVAVLAALAAAFVVAYRKSETFRAIVNAVWDAIKAVAVATWDVIKGVFDAIIAYYRTVFDVGKGVIGALVDGIKAVGGWIANAAGWVKDRFLEGVRAYLGLYKNVGGWIINRLTEGVQAVGAFAANVGGWVKNRVIDGIQALAGAFLGVGGWITQRLSEGLRAVATFAGNVGGWVKDRVVDGIKATVDAIRSVGGWITDRVVGGLKAVGGVAADIAGWIKERLSAVWDNVKERAGNIGENIGNAIKGGIRGAIDGIAAVVSGALNVAIRAVNTLIRGANRLPKVDIPLIPELYTGARNFAGGIALVGERGPELVNLPRGSDVYSNRESRAMLGTAAPGGGPGGVTVVQNIENMNVNDRFDEQRMAIDLAWKVRTA